MTVCSFGAVVESTTVLRESDSISLSMFFHVDGTATLICVTRIIQVTALHQNSACYTENVTRSDDEFSLQHGSSLRRCSSWYCTAGSSSS